MDSLASHRRSSMRRRCHVNDIQEAVRERYAAKALQMADSSSCCRTSCCGDTGCGEGYTAQELASVGVDPTASLGCGNPTLLADLRPGERVLGRGGRWAVAAMVAIGELPAEVKRSLDQWAGCVAGTISIDEYTTALRDVGFRDVDVEITRETRLEGVDGAIASAYIRARKEVFA